MFGSLLADNRIEGFSCIEVKLQDRKHSLEKKSAMECFYVMVLVPACTTGQGFDVIIWLLSQL